MKANDREILMVRSKASPTVEIDTEASAAYVRFKRAKVAKTIRHSSKWPIVTIDLDKRGHVIGVEFVGVKKFNLNYLLQGIHIKAPVRTIGRATYISADSRQSEK